MTTDSKVSVYEIFVLLSQREALLLAESELAGFTSDVESWKGALSKNESEVLSAFERAVKRAYDDIVHAHTEGLH